MVEEQEKVKVAAWRAHETVALVSKKEVNHCDDIFAPCCGSGASTTGREAEIEGRWRLPAALLTRLVQVL
jgi:hypothetical protein